jgi:hypothetical protein
MNVLETPVLMVKNVEEFKTFQTGPQYPLRDYLFFD